ncbi:hypothetical protein NN561_010299 [Cricetulus griseus]
MPCAPSSLELSWDRAPVNSHARTPSRPCAHARARVWRLSQQALRAPLLGSPMIPCAPPSGQVWCSQLLRPARAFRIAVGPRSPRPPLSPGSTPHPRQAQRREGSCQGSHRVWSPQRPCAPQGFVKAHSLSLACPLWTACHRALLSTQTASVLRKQSSAWSSESTRPELLVPPCNTCRHAVCSVTTPARPYGLSLTKPEFAQRLAQLTEIPK